MTVWEIDFYRRPLRSEAGDLVWELLVCDRVGTLKYSTFCTQAQATASWLFEQLKQLAAAGHLLPEQIAVFRPQTLNLLQTVGPRLGIPIIPTRRLPTLSQWLVERATQYATLPNYTGEPYQPLALEQPPPVPIADSLMGDRWRFAALPAGQLVAAFTGRMIPIVQIPEEYQPLRLGLASDSPIPGVVIDAGRQSMRLATWVQSVYPAALRYVAGTPDGLILDAGLVDRWVLATFEDTEVQAAAQVYQQRQQQAQGLHFLLIRPDDSGMTYSGIWLLRD